MPKNEEISAKENRHENVEKVPEEPSSSAQKLLLSRLEEHVKETYVFLCEIQEKDVLDFDSLDLEELVEMNRK